LIDKGPEISNNTPAQGLDVIPAFQTGKNPARTLGIREIPDLHAYPVVIGF
jgi:hypothetical protein